MKLHVLLLLATVSTASFAQQCPSGSATNCGEAYSRLQAYQALIAAENSQSDAEGNLQLVMQANRSHGISLQQATESFNEILRIMGGSSETVLARNTFSNLLSKSSQSGYSLPRLVAVLEQMVLAENSSSDALGNLDAIMPVVRHRIALEEAAQVFNGLLGLGGSSTTVHTRIVFATFLRNLQVAGLGSLLESYTQLYHAENSETDALGNFELVLRAAAICRSIEVATWDFNETLRISGGSSNTVAARNTYRTLYGI